MKLFTRNEIPKWILGIILLMLIAFLASKPDSKSEEDTSNSIEFRK